MSAAAPLFKPFRALGYITDNVPFAVNRRGKEAYVVVSVGKAWQVYNCAKLTLTLVGPQLEGSIRALACKNDLTFAAVGRDIVECKRVHRSGVYRGAHSGPILQLLVLADLLLSLGADGKLVVWVLGQYAEPQAVLQMPQGFIPTAMCHPDTYINKVLVGSERGQLALWNFNTATLLHTFEGWGCAVRCLAPSPALDVVGVGLADGRVVLHNVRFDEEVASFANASGAGLASDLLLGGGAGLAAGGGASGGAVTAISFRTGVGAPLMAAGGGAGAVTVWDLGGRRLQTVIKEAHGGPLLSLHFFPGEPLLMSSGADNSVKHWLFDAADGTARLLRFRGGHAAPPTLVRHYGQGGLRLLSAGCDRAFRVFSVHQDQQSRELSQGHTAARAKRLKIKEAEVKLERVVAADACEVRERDWANVLTAHEGDPAAYTWRLATWALGDHCLVPPPEEMERTAPGAGAAGRRDGAPAPAPAPVTSVALSRCGNFGIVGSAAGRIDRYNMQSGQHRGAYYRKAPAHAQQAAQQAAGRAPAAAAAGGLLPAHAGAVVGLGADACNRLLVSAGFDGLLRVWDFKGLTCKAEVSLGGPASLLALHPGSCLAAVALADSSLRLYDVEAPRLVRRFRGHRDRVTGLHLAGDSRWLLSSSMDGTLRVWDIPSAQCLQVLVLGAPVTSLSLSPSLDLLATTHVNRRGIYLWSNQELFGAPAALAPAPSDAPVAVVRCSLPTISSAAAAQQRGEEGAGGAAEEGGLAAAGSDEEDEDGLDSDEEERAMADRRAAAASAGTSAAAAAPRRPYAGVDPVSGAPLPLAPSLVTLSLLPRAQWDSLAHIEVIKARNKPLQPPKKPEAAPFFLPTLPGLDPNPVFDLGPAAALGGEEGDDDGGGKAGGKRGAGAAAASRVVRGQQGPAAAPMISTFLQALRKAAAAAAAEAGAGAEAGAEAVAGSASSSYAPYAPLMALLRSMTPTAIDRELRAMQVLEGSSSEEQEVSDLAALLDCLAACLAGRRDYEFCQALLTVVLQLQGDVLASVPSLARRTALLRDLSAASWARLDGLLQGTRCMVAYFGNLQGA